MSTVRGWVLECWDAWLGSTVTESAALGATTLVVEDAGDFDEAGGVLLLNGVQYEYAAGPLDDNTLTLVDPLTEAIEPDEFAYVWDTIYGTPNLEVKATVELIGAHSALVSNEVPAVVSHALTDRIPRGGRGGRRGEVVLLEDYGSGYRVVDVLAKQTVVNGLYLDPTTIPEIVPTEPPAASPALTSTGLPAQIVLRAENIEAGVLIEYHLSTDPEHVFVAGDASTLSVATRSTIYVVTEQPNGAPLDPEVTYYAAAIATNVVGAAPPSPTIEAAIDLDAISVVVAAELVAGFVLAGTIQVGQMLIDANDGITIPQPGGRVIHFPVDGSEALVQAFIVATGLTVEDNAFLFGLTQLFGTMRFANGITDPTVPPLLGRGWEVSNATAGAFPQYNSGVMEMIGDSTKWVIVANIFGGVFGVHEKGGTQVAAHAMPSDFYPTSACVHGSSYYVLGSKGTSLGSEPWVYIFNSSFVKTGEWRASPAGFSVYTEWDTTAHYGSATNAKRQVIISNGANVTLARMHTHTSGTRFVLRHLNPTTGLEAASATTLAVSGSSPEDLWTMFVGASFDLGSARYLALSSTRVYSYNGGTRQPTEEWPLPNAQTNWRGLTWDGTRFFALDASGKIWRFAAGRTVSSTVYGRYSHADADATGGTHETAKSPQTAFVWPARSYLTITAVQPAPDAGVTDPSKTDKANLVRFWLGTASGGTTFLQGPQPGVGELSLVLENIDTGSTSSTFGSFGTAGSAPGRAESTAVDGTTENIWWFEGDGTARWGDLRIAADGTVSHVDDTDWANLTHAGTSGTVRWRCLNRTVWLEGSVNFASLANAATLNLVIAANGIPAAYRAGQSLWADVIRLNAGTTFGPLAVFADGSISLQNQCGAAATAAQFSTSWPME